MSKGPGLADSGTLHQGRVLGQSDVPQWVIMNELVSTHLGLP